MPLDLSNAPDGDDDHDTVVADSFTIRSFDPEHGQISLWLDGDKTPFAIAYFTADSAIQIARALLAVLPAAGRA